MTKAGIISTDPVASEADHSRSTINIRVSTERNIRFSLGLKYKGLLGVRSTKERFMKLAHCSGSQLGVCLGIELIYLDDSDGSHILTHKGRRVSTTLICRYQSTLTTVSAMKDSSIQLDVWSSAFTR